jgi:hypothetical protein
VNYPRWEFRKMSRGEINIDPIEGEFFSTEALGSLSDALIREAIQNSLDAALLGEQVKVAITFSSSDQNLPASQSENYLRGLRSHLEAKESGLIERVILTDPMDFLVIEDFGTRGLEGDIREDEERGAEEKKNDFLYFWRNIGRAVEGTTARGRWGLGKTVFQAASRINSFFGLTIRRGDPSKLLMGQSVLKIHWCDGSKHGPYGYYGLFEGDFALPFEGKQFVEQFSRDFSLRRNGESGLSIIVPFPESDISPSEIIRAVVNQYFFPILSGDLVVIVVVGHREYVLDAGSVFESVSGSDLPDKDTVLRRLKLAKWCIDLPVESYGRLREPEVDQAPKWEESLFGPEELNLLRKKLDEGERIALLAPLWVRKEGEDIQHSSFKVFLERDDTLERGEDFFIRDGVTITGISSLRQKSVRVIASVSDRPLSKLLGDAENPAHTEWQERSPKFRGRYVRGASCLRYVKNSPREIVKILSRPAEGRDIKLLRDLFYIDLPKAIEAQGSSNKPTETPGTDGPGTPGPGIVTADRFLQLQRTKQGFRLSARPDADPLPKEIDIEVAYDVRQGNPFNRYSHFDFELNKPPIRVSTKGLKASISKSNMIHIVLEERGFELSVTGFDPNRDLKIRTTTSLDAVL